MSNPYSMPQADLLERTGDDTYMPKFFSLNGRIGRVRYFAYGIGTGLLMIPALSLLAVLGALLGNGASGSIGGTIIGYVLYFAALFTQVRRRLHDLNKSGWMGLLMYVPIVNFFFALWVLFARGDEGANDYGPAPAPNTTGVIVVAWILPVIMIIMFSIIAAVSIPAYQDYVTRARAAQMQDGQ